MTRYKTHEELGVTFAEYGAVFAVKALLEAGVLKHKFAPKQSLRPSYRARRG